MAGSGTGVEYWDWVECFELRLNLGLGQKLELRLGRRFWPQLGLRTKLGAGAVNASKLDMVRGFNC